MLGTIFYLSNKWGMCKNVMRAYFLFCLFGWGLGTGNDKQWPWGLGTEAFTSKQRKSSLISAPNCKTLKTMAYCSPTFSPKTLLKYKHGLAYVSNVDGRGIFSIYGIFKRGDEPAKMTYNLVNILCYVGGEIRDGFFFEKLKESELVSILESNFRMAKGKAFFQLCPIEEAAKLLVIPCYEKAKKRGIEIFKNHDVQRSFEFYERISCFCSCSNEEEFLLAKCGCDVKKAFTHLDLRRPELDAWWLEKTELNHLGCPAPPPPMNFPESETIFSGSDNMIDFMSEANNQRERTSAWKKRVLEMFSTSVNFARLIGAAQHQALWYLWKGDQKMAITMLDSVSRIRKDQIEERTLSAKIPVVELFLNLTQIQLAKMGECEGQLSTVDWQQSAEHFCKTCHSPAKRVMSGFSSGSWILTCVEKDGKGMIGTDASRRNLITALAIVKRIESKAEFKTVIDFSLKESLEAFLEHSFVNLYWKNKPTPPMTESLIDDAVCDFVDAIDCARFEPFEWAKSCTEILKDLMEKHCHEKLSETNITDVAVLFQKAFESQIIQNIEKVEEVPQYASLHEDRSSLYQLNSVMTALTVAPSVVSCFLLKWKNKTDFEKKKALSASLNEFLASMKKVYEGYSKKSLPLCLREDVDSSQPSSIRKKRQCACQDLAKFQDYVVELLCGAKNPVSFLSCSLDGSVSLSAALFVDNCGELIKDMVLCHDIYIYEEIMDADNLEGFAKCPRLAMLCKFACSEIYTWLKVSKHFFNVHFKSYHSNEN